MTTVRSDASSAVLHVELPDRADRLVPGRAEQRTDLQDQPRIKAKKEVDVERTPVAAPGTEDGCGGLRPRVAARAQRHDRARRVAQHHLVGGSLGALAQDGTLLGPLFESLVTQGVRVYAQHSGAGVRHLRISSGTREVDLVVERADRRVLAAEVKLSVTVEDRDVVHRG